MLSAATCDATLPPPLLSPLLTALLKIPDIDDIIFSLQIVINDYRPAEKSLEKKNVKKAKRAVRAKWPE
ncbi:hypothetical protein PANT111_160079 [Pantoea brenneri]|uniref:Uncharacterized protein n=1 Tax=Pantoea brenneri TaxID=472694 RepID=A0AAX3J6L1_9GAMM|nr:hypothetical protein PANT111_160079 [Pantoea brenneri]